MTTLHAGMWSTTYLVYCVVIVNLFEDIGKNTRRHVCDIIISLMAMNSGEKNPGIHDA